MDRQIRRLGIALDRAVRGAVRAARLRAGGGRRPHQERRGQRHSPDHRRVPGRPGADPHVRRQGARAQQRAQGERSGTSGRYPEGPLYSAITGFYSRIYGRTGLEESMNEFLAGDAPELAVSNLQRPGAGQAEEGRVGGHVDPQLAPAGGGHRARHDLPGAVVAIDPRNGDVLAMVANPSYDPNDLSSGTEAQIRRAWKDYNDDPDKPLLSRAKDELYLPGSTFKIVTASAGAVERVLAIEPARQPARPRPPADDGHAGELRRLVRATGARRPSRSPRRSGHRAT